MVLPVNIVCFQMFSQEGGYGQPGSRIILIKDY